MSITDKKIFNTLNRICSNLKVFGAKAACQDLVEILRAKILNQRLYILHVLEGGGNFHDLDNTHEVEIVFGDANCLSPYVYQEDLELSAEFIDESKHAEVVILKNKGSKELLAYGFFTDKPTSIAGKMIFKPSSNSTYLFKIFVKQEVRRRKFLKKIVSEIIKFQGRKKSENMIAIIIANNFVSRRAFKSIGFKPLFAFPVNPEYNKQIQIN